MTRGMLRLFAVIAALGTSGCENILDFRPDGLNAGSAARPTEARPPADDRGVISYPGYQVAVAQEGDTTASVATRIGLTPVELATFNGIPEQAPLRPGEVLALPRRVAEPSEDTGAVVNGPIRPGAVNITQLAEAAIERATPATRAAIAAAPAAAAVSGREPIRHKVERGETAFTVARLYNVSVPSLAEWNALGPELALREGQFLLIPVVAVPGTQAGTQTAAPGAGSDTPVPPSAVQPLPEETEETRIATAPEVRVTPVASPEPAPRLSDPEPLPDTVVAAVPEPRAPTVPALPEVRAPSPAPALDPEPAPAPSGPIVVRTPDLSAEEPEPETATAARSGPSLRAPVSGPVVKPFSPGSNDGVDFSASPGTAVRAAASGTVAAITEDTNNVPILVIRHPGNLLTVYQYIDGVRVRKGDTVTAGQTVAEASASSSVVHFEVREGFEAVDPTEYLE